MSCFAFELGWKILCGCRGRALLRVCLKLRFELTRPGARCRVCVEPTRPHPVRADPIAAGRALSRECLKLRLDLSTCAGLARVVESVFETVLRPEPGPIRPGLIRQFWPPETRPDLAMPDLTGGFFLGGLFFFVPFLCLLGVPRGARCRECV